jgi:hypothetical protein
LGARIEFGQGYHSNGRVVAREAGRGKKVTIETQARKRNPQNTTMNEGAPNQIKKVARSLGPREHKSALPSNVRNVKGRLDKG